MFSLLNKYWRTENLVFLHKNDVIFAYLVVSDPAIVSPINLTNNNRSIFRHNCPQ